MTIQFNNPTVQNYVDKYNNLSATQKLITNIQADLDMRIINAKDNLSYFYKVQGLKQEDIAEAKNRWETEIEYCEKRIEMLKGEQEASLLKAYTYRTKEGEKTVMYFEAWITEINIILQSNI